MWLPDECIVLSSNANRVSCQVFCSWNHVNQSFWSLNETLQPKFVNPHTLSAIKQIETNIQNNSYTFRVRKHTNSIVTCILSFCHFIWRRKSDENLLSGERYQWKMCTHFGVSENHSIDNVCTAINSGYTTKQFWCWFDG